MNMSLMVMVVNRTLVQPCNRSFTPPHVSTFYGLFLLSCQKYKVHIQSSPISSMMSSLQLIIFIQNAIAIVIIVLGIDETVAIIIFILIQDTITVIIFILIVRNAIIVVIIVYIIRFTVAITVHGGVHKGDCGEEEPQQQQIPPHVERLSSLSVVYCVPC